MAGREPDPPALGLEKGYGACVGSRPKQKKELLKISTQRLPPIQSSRLNLDYIIIQAGSESKFGRRKPEKGISPNGGDLEARPFGP